MFITFLSAGMVLGLSAGFSPGPLLTLVISHTLQHGIHAGIKVAIAPLLTDAPIILISVFLLTQLANLNGVLGVMSFLGGAFLIYLAVETWRTSTPNLNVRDAGSQSILKGVMVNALNPHPYVFWITVGAPTMLKAWADSLASAFAFIVAFFVCIIGAKIVMAILASTSQQWLRGTGYVYLMRALAIALGVFALVLIRDGLGLLGIWQG